MKSKKIIAIFLILGGLSLGGSQLHPSIKGWLKNAVFGKNIHTVKGTRGQIIRSAQLSPRTLRKVIRKHNIKIVLNLRGSNPGKKWYEREKRVSRDFEVKLVNIPMSTDLFPTKQNLAKLLKVFEYARKSGKKILIHCKCGADRTGEACATWLLSKGKSLKCALRQLTVGFRHFAKLHPGKRKFVRYWDYLSRKHGSDEEALKHYKPIGKYVSLSR